MILTVYIGSSDASYDGLLRTDLKEADRLRGAFSPFPYAADRKDHLGNRIKLPPTRFEFIGIWKPENIFFSSSSRGKRVCENRRLWYRATFQTKVFAKNKSKSWQRKRTRRHMILQRSQRATHRSRVGAGNAALYVAGTSLRRGH